MRKLFFAGCIAVLAVACKADKIQPIDPDCPDTISYSTTIEPLIITNCSTSGCHAVGFTSPALTNHTEIATNADQILNRIQLDPTNGQLMPSGGPKLADSLIQQFKCWVNQGSQDN